MKNKSDITIKDLADELGITKQAVRRYFEQLPSELVPTKKGGSYQINAKAQDFIRDKVNRVDTKLDSQVGINKDSFSVNIDTNVDSENELIKFQKEFIQDKNEQIKSLKEQINKLHMLLDQQQQLTLQSNKQIEKLQLQLETDTTTKKEEDPGIQANQFNDSANHQEQQLNELKKELEQKELENKKLQEKMTELQQTPKKGFWQRLFHS